MRIAVSALNDILLTVDRVTSKLAAVPLDEFLASWELCVIAQRALEIISEASRRIPRELKARRPEIDWQGVADIGNVLRHEYHVISDRLLWKVIQEELPPLRLAVQTILEEVRDRG